MTTPSDRIRKIDAGNMMLPACCMICGSVSDENGYADLQLQIEWHGNLYLCSKCSFSIAEFWGAVRPEEHAELRQERDDLEVAMLKFRGQVEQFGVLRDAALAISESNDSVDPNNYGVSVGGVSSSEDHVSQFTSGQQGIDATQPITTEPTNVEGPDDISGSTADDLIASLI